MAIYMKVPGAEGSVTASGYEKWIELDSMNFGVHRTVSMDTGNMANRAAGLPSFSEISVSKATDNSTYGLLTEAVLGKEGKEIELAVVEPGDAPIEYVKYTLKDAIISAYDMSAGPDGMPMESVTISYSWVEIAFTAHDQANKPGTVGRVSYDLAAGTKG
jgi:type VI secretion system secreted protein Hcp